MGVMRVNSTSAGVVTPGSSSLSPATPYAGYGAALPETATSLPLPMATSQEESAMMNVYGAQSVTPAGLEVVDTGVVAQEEDEEYNEMYGAGVTAGQGQVEV